MARNRHPTLSSLGRSPSRKIPLTPVPEQPPVQPPTVKRPPTAPGMPGPASPVLPTAPPPPERGVIVGWLRDAMVENLGLKFLSLVLAVTVFLLVNTDRDNERTAKYGVTYALPDDKVLVSERIDEVRVTLKASSRKLRNFNETSLDRINIDLRKATSGDIPITLDMINVPDGMTVVSYTPKQVKVVLEKRVEKVVEIAPALVGRPVHGFVVAEVKATPTTVRVRGAEGQLRSLISVRTREISLETRDDNFKLATSIVPPEGIEVVSDTPIEIQVHIDEELVSRKVTSLTVFARGDGTTPVDPTKWIISPPQVDITLTGALLAVEKAKDAMKLVVKLAPDGRGRDAAEVLVEGLPPGVGVKVSPERVTITPAAR